MSIWCKGFDFVSLYESFNQCLYMWTRDGITLSILLNLADLHQLKTLKSLAHIEMNEGICFYLVSYTRTIMNGFFLLYYLFYSLIHDVQTNEPQERMLIQLSGRIRHRVQNIQWVNMAFLECLLLKRSFLFIDVMKFHVITRLVKVILQHKGKIEWTNSNL